MINKLLRASSYMILFVFITSSSLLLDIYPSQAAQMASNSNENNSMGFVIKKSSDAFDGSKINAATDLGDDQAFPFTAGLGKILARTDLHFV